MNKGIKILIGISVVIIILISGWWAWEQFYSRPECFEFPNHCFKPFQKYDNRIAKLSICQFDEDCNLTDLAFRCVNKGNSIEAENLEKLLIKDCPEVTPADKSIFRCECKNNICTTIQERFPEEPQEEVTITTDKTEYEQGETVKITITNDLPYIVIPYPNPKITKFLGENYGIGLIEKLEEGTWVKIEPVWRCGNSCFDECKYKHSFEPGEKRVFEWNQTILNCDRVNLTEKIEKAEPGKYRVNSHIWLEEEQTYKTSYSNEFTIKEK